MKKIRISFVLLALMAVALSSCGLFKRKGKCMDCPKWSQESPSSPKRGIPS